MIDKASRGACNHSREFRHVNETEEKLPLGLITAGQAMDMMLVEMAEDRRRPLVTLDETHADGRVAFTFHDREVPGSAYEFWCCGQGDALRWIAHMAQKRWVTIRHLEWFATLILDAYKLPR